MGRYQENEIVIIDTFDPLHGQVRMPAIVRYEHTDHPGYYEVNALIPSGGHAAGPRELVWWTVKEDEIAQSLGLGQVEHGPQPRVNGRWVFIPDDAPDTIEQSHGHRITGA
jgi:hypothetical protein